MQYKIIITSNANKDIQKAIYWEEDRSKGLGEKFYLDLDKRLKTLANSPAIGTIRYDDVRCISTKVFQYLIHYTINDSQKEITILRIWHTRQNPIGE
jgi:plasmid stabilization system protein ParE